MVGASVTGRADGTNELRQVGDSRQTGNGARLKSTSKQTNHHTQRQHDSPDMSRYINIVCCDRVHGENGLITQSGPRVRGERIYP
eukprot:9504006-Pyramimonas_sp.AAC.2